MFYPDFKLRVRLRENFTKCEMLNKLKYNIYFIPLNH